MIMGAMTDKGKKYFRQKDDFQEFLNLCPRDTGAQSLQTHQACQPSCVVQPTSESSGFTDIKVGNVKSGLEKARTGLSSWLGL